MEDVAFMPVRTMADLDSLDPEEIVEGYCAGHEGDPEPGHNRGRAYWHGWRNGAVDSGRRKVDCEQVQLAHAYCSRGSDLFAAANRGKPE